MRTRARLGNKWVVSSYEIYNSESEPPSLLMAQLQRVVLGTPKLTEPNPTTNALKTQEPLSPIEQANAEKHELTLKTMQKMHKTKHKMKL
ncbi:DUF3519 domain-containing protein [Helicobacter pylori]|uniref:DUF3519 domain-containing protein n=1 Tax=Helicobacter pylori TaxID=210 RepID=UPI0039E29328